MANTDTDTISNEDEEIENKEIHDDETFEIFYNREVIELRKLDEKFPDTVKILEKPCGSKVYIVGTAHFSVESIEEVKMVIGRTLPDFVVLELCKSRSVMLEIDDSTFHKQIASLNLVEVIKQKGVSQGIVHYLMLRMSNHLVQQIGMLPGGEFRAAYKKSEEYPHTAVVLGDRPIDITMKRAWASLGLWGRIKLMVALLFGLKPISREEIERMKNTDILEELMRELGAELPSFSRVIVAERDQYLARSIWQAARPLVFEQSIQSESGDHLMNSQREEGEVTMTAIPSVTVAVVGIGHMAGIVRHWQEAEFIDNRMLHRIDPAPASWRIFVSIVKLLAVSGIGLAGYNICTTLYPYVSSNK